MVRVDSQRIEYLRSQFGAFCADEEEEVEVRCMIVPSLFSGSSFVAAEHGERSRWDVIESILERLEA